MEFGYTNKRVEELVNPLKVSARKPRTTIALLNLTKLHFQSERQWTNQISMCAASLNDSCD